MDRVNVCLGPVHLSSVRRSARGLAHGQVGGTLRTRTGWRDTEEKKVKQRQGLFGLLVKVGHWSLW